MWEYLELEFVCVWEVVVLCKWNVKILKLIKYLLKKKKLEKKKNKNKGVFNELSEIFLFIYKCIFF